MGNFETLTLTIRDGSRKIIEEWKWAISRWDKLEHTWSYLRRKYGTSKAEAEKSFGNNNSWVSE